MGLPRLLISAILLSVSLSGSVQAEPPKDVRVTFAAGLRKTQAGTGVYRCDIWNLFGTVELWSRAHRLKDKEIGRGIYAMSRMSDALEIWVGVDSPKHTNFSDVTDIIARLKPLVLKNTREGCPVEIKVYPLSYISGHSANSDQASGGE